MDDRTKVVELITVFTAGALDRDRETWLGRSKEDPEDSPEDIEALQRLTYIAERRVDELQTYLARAWMQFTYGLSYVLLGVLLFPLVAAIRLAIVSRPTGGTISPGDVDLATLAFGDQAQLERYVSAEGWRVVLALAVALAFLVVVGVDGPKDRYGLLLALIPVVWLLLGTAAFNASLGMPDSVLSAALGIGAVTGLLAPAAGKLLDSLTGLP
jgi:hypothetical protein